MTDQDIISQILSREGGWVNALTSAIERAIEAEVMAADAVRPYTPPPNARQYPCSHEGCDRAAYARRLCNAHYMRYRQGRPMAGRIATRVSSGDARCACGKRVGSRGGWGRCSSHYRLRRKEVIKRTIAEFLGNACVFCGKSYPDAAMDLHHGSPKGDSGRHPSRLVSMASVSEVAREASLCVLSCANCHRIHHANEKAA